VNFYVQLPYHCSLTSSQWPNEGDEIDRACSTLVENKEVKNFGGT
jgi:hypothetical protein